MSATIKKSDSKSASKKSRVTKGNPGQERSRTLTETNPETPATPETPVKKASLLDSAYRVLQESEHPLSCNEILAIITDKGFWSSPKGKTPHATLYSAILREMRIKGETARFQKTVRGRFVAPVA